MPPRWAAAAALLTAMLAAADGAGAQTVAPSLDLGPRAARVWPVELVGEPAPMRSGDDGADASADGSPYRLSWRKDGLLFAGTGAGILLAAALPDDAPELTPEDLAGLSRDDVIWFDRPATRRHSTDLIRLSQYLRTPLALAPLALLADPRVRSDWQSLAVMYAQTTMLAAAAPGIAKATVSRHRPFVYNTDLSAEERLDRDPGKSFFSRTTTTAFASAVFFATVFGDHRPDSALRPWVWGTALAAGGTVGYLRFASGVHYPSDVVVGAAVGTAAGYLVPRIHRVEDGALSVELGVGPGGGITLSGRARF